MTCTSPSCCAPFFFLVSSSHSFSKCAFLSPLRCTPPHFNAPRSSCCGGAAVGGKASMCGRVEHCSCVLALAESLALFFSSSHHQFNFLFQCNTIHCEMSSNRWCKSSAPRVYVCVVCVLQTRSPAVAAWCRCVSIVKNA